jgi:hypothetical protein
MRTNGADLVKLKAAVELYNDIMAKKRSGFLEEPLRCEDVVG